MKTSDRLSDSLPSTPKSEAKCEQCGASARLDTGVCVSCLLREGLEDIGEASRAIYESVLAEVDVQDEQWQPGNYEILEEIKRGGMGVIYRARQRHSRRIVAVKCVLSYQADSHETLKRFQREAEAVASLDHPNILPIYEVSESEDGLPFFSMKFATGGSLHEAGPSLRNEPRKCVQLMAKVARATEYAHGRGILHRDLKPGNILLDGRGEPLVSDFGLAKWLDANKEVTKSLTIFGTPGYIAPEQAEGSADDLTLAADVYSLGAILFDLLTGRPPFLGANALSIIRQAAEMPAPKLRLFGQSHDRDLETICARCLERDPKARYQSAGALATDLERWLDGRPIVARPVSPSTRIWRWSRRNLKLLATGAACLLFGAAVIWFFRGELVRMPPLDPLEKSIAVLPFSNLSKEEENTFFADGVQDEILTDLSRVGDLKLISRASVMQYKSGVPRNLRKIGRQLGVTHVVEGSVQRSHNRVRVNVQLVDAHIGRQLWAETYDRDLADVFAIQSEIAQKVAQQLHAKISAGEKAATQRDYDGALAELEVAPQTLSNNRQVVELKGYIKRRQRHWEESTRGLEHAIDLDPRNFLTLQQITISYGVLRRYGEEKSVLDRALTIEPSDVDTKLAFASVEFDSKADTRALLRTIDSIRATSPEALPNIANGWLSCALAERDIAAARNALNTLGEIPLTGLGRSPEPLVDGRNYRTYDERRGHSAWRIHGCALSAEENRPGSARLRSGAIRARFNRRRPWTQSFAQRFLYLFQRKNGQIRNHAVRRRGLGSIASRSSPSPSVRRAPSATVN